MSTATITSTALSQHHETAQQLPRASRPLAAVTGAELQAPLIQGGHIRYANLDYGASHLP